MSRRHLLLCQLEACILGFENLKPLYAINKNFGELHSACQKHLKGDFLIQEE